MKITVTKSAQITFKEIKIGDVFQIRGGGEFYMKIYDRMDEEYNRLNAICLSTTHLYVIKQDAPIFPVDCELIIK